MRTDKQRIFILEQRIILLENRINVISDDIERNCEVANYNVKEQNKIINKIVKKLFWITRKIEYVNYIPK